VVRVKVRVNLTLTHCNDSMQFFLHDTLRVPGRSGPIAIAALFSLLLTLGNYTPKGIKIIIAQLNDEVVRVAVALRLGLNLGVPHTCRCGATADVLGQHSLVCKQAPSKIARHQHLNDLVTRALVSAGVPTTKEPVGLIRRDCKRQDGMT